MNTNHKLFYQSYITELQDDINHLDNSKLKNRLMIKELIKRIKHWNDKIDDLYKVKDYITINRGYK